MYLKFVGRTGANTNVANDSKFNNKDKSIDSAAIDVQHTTSTTGAQAVCLVILMKMLGYLIFI